MNDVYTQTVSGTSATWASLSSIGATPSARYRHSMTALADGTAVLVGGYDGNYRNDVCTLTLLPSPTAPPTPSPTASPTPQDEVSVSGHARLKIHFLFLELTLHSIVRPWTLARQRISRDGSLSPKKISICVRTPLAPRSFLFSFHPLSLLPSFFFVPSPFSLFFPPLSFSFFSHLPPETELEATDCFNSLRQSVVASGD